LSTVPSDSVQHFHFLSIDIFKYDAASFALDLWGIKIALFVAADAI